jgi:hypothetical protein
MVGPFYRVAKVMAGKAFQQATPPVRTYSRRADSPMIVGWVGTIRASLAAGCGPAARLPLGRTLGPRPSRTVLEYGTVLEDCTFVEDLDASPREEAARSWAFPRLSSSAGPTWARAAF